MHHRVAAEIIVDLNRLYDNAINDRMRKLTIRAVLCELGREIEAALNDESLTQDQRRDYDEAYRHWDAVYKAIFGQSEELGDGRDCCTSQARAGSRL